MSELLKTACKTSQGTAVAPLAQADGTQIAERKFGTAVFTFFSAEGIRNTNDHDSPTVDVSEYGLVSLRIANGLKDGSGAAIPVTIKFKNDAINDTYTLRHIDGSDIKYTIPGGYYVVLPDDIPLLNYFSSLTIRVKASAVPSSGSISISAVCKR